MRDPRRRAGVAFYLCLSALPVGGLAYLALADIAQGGEDLSLEWSVLRAAFPIVGAALAASLRALYGVLEAAQPR